MFAPGGPSLRELAVQALSSVEHGYDLLAPKFDRTPFRTSRRVLDAVAAALAEEGPFDEGLDLCCGTGAGTEVTARLCRTGATGLDFSAGMLAVARSRTHGAPPAVPPTGADGGPAAAVPSGPACAPAGVRTSWVRADARALPFRSAFDLVVSFGALGHFLPRELPGLFAQVQGVLRPGGLFALPVLAPPRPASPAFWTLLGFDTVMRVRNALWRPPFVMYYRTMYLGGVLRELERAGFRVELRPLAGFGRRDDGTPRARLVVARRPPEGPGGGPSARPPAG
ncbi:class I SAM-dependent methyltransferase [Streptomyces tropicalis]|uniref:Class I SAM-dependent methyltransferase n=1 Tax=Streptomyces tropicalis TaxID=3034234 RepID=A0ABT6A9P3_9ACTN|nr:class I SAM-dependent methyltransferase [Streptomyces tropicalis]MDF3301378.1 class I SAM-dependent methyltransferase [Streptomyces tropicalis]